MFSRPLCRAHKFACGILLLALVTVPTVVCPQSRLTLVNASSYAPALAPVEPRITFDPEVPGVSAGTKVIVTATVFDEENKKVTPDPADKEKWSWKVADPNLEELLMVTKLSNGNQAAVVGLAGSNKARSERPNLIPIIVEFNGATKATGVVNVRLEDAPLARGPIPPGIDSQVDVMWAVMPQKNQ
jgi:hypothetical protein